MLRLIKGHASRSRSLLRWGPADGGPSGVVCVCLFVVPPGLPRHERVSRSGLGYRPCALQRSVINNISLGGFRPPDPHLVFAVVVLLCLLFVFIFTADGKDRQNDRN